MSNVRCAPLLDAYVNGVPVIPKTVALLKSLSKAELMMILTDHVLDTYPDLYKGYEADAAKFVKNTMGKTRKDLLLSAQVKGLVPYEWEEKVGPRTPLWSNS